jgi:outer membrane protein TolC
LQPLDAFIKAAKQRNDSNRQASALKISDQEQLKAATGKLLPSLSAQGTYTRNQFHADFVIPGAAGTPETRLTFLPTNQLDGAITINVPIIDLENYARRTVALQTVRATTAAYDATQQSTDKQVAQAYYGLVGQQRVYDASVRSLEVIQRAESITRDRLEAGVASPLELERSLADTARAQQSVTDAALQVALAERLLETISMLAPEGQAKLIVDDLHQEQPLAHWMGEADIEALPHVVAAGARAQASLAGLRAARYGYVPTLAAKAQEKFTNLTGLNGGHAAVWSVSASLAWNLDFTLTPLRRAQAAQVESDLAAQHQVTRQTQDNLFEDWHRIRAGIDKCRAARQESRASALAASLSLEQYAVGSDTQLDVLQATKEAFAADVKSIQADSDLIYQRALLRIDAGRPLVSQEIEP